MLQHHNHNHNHEQESDRRKVKIKVTGHQSGRSFCSGCHHERLDRKKKFNQKHSSIATNTYRNASDVLDGTTISNDLVAGLLGPVATGDEVAEHVLVDDSELTRQHTARVHVRGEGLEALVVAEDLVFVQAKEWDSRSIAANEN